MPKGDAHARFEARMGAKVHARLSVKHTEKAIKNKTRASKRRAQQKHARAYHGWDEFEEEIYWLNRRLQFKDMWQQIEYNTNPVDAPIMLSCRDTTARCGSGDGRVVRKIIKAY